MTLVDLRRPILVTTESFNYLKDLEVVNDDASEIRATLIQFDELSRNKAEYPRDDLMRSMNESRYVQENYRNKTWFGELEHPPADAKMDRFMFVEPTRYCWLIKKYWEEGDCLKAICAFVPPLGTEIVQKIIQTQGSNWAASLRAYTPNFIKKQGSSGEYIVKKYPMYPVTFDAVSCPGLFKARLVDPNKFQAEAFGKESACRNIIFNQPEETLRSMLMSSENAPIIEDLFGIDFKRAKMLLTRDDRLEVTSESGIKMTLPMNTYLVGEALKGIPRRKI
jgi:hypothetical protein